METDCKRFDQRAFHRADTVRQFKAQIRFVSDVFLKDDVYRRRRKEYNVRAEIIAPCFAKFTVAACLPRLQCHAVPRLQMRHIFSNFYHRASRLMAEDKG